MASKEELPDVYVDFSDELIELLHLTVRYKENEKERLKLALRIENLMKKMVKIAKQIGGKILEHFNTLQIDLTHFLEDRNNLAKILKDSQVLKNDLRDL